MDEVKQQTKANMGLAPNEKGMASVEVEGTCILQSSVRSSAKNQAAAQDYLGEDVNEAVITVPAYFTDNQRQAAGRWHHCRTRRARIINRRQPWRMSTHERAAQKLLFTIRRYLIFRCCAWTLTSQKYWPRAVTMCLAVEMLIRRSLHGSKRKLALSRVTTSSKTSRCRRARENRTIQHHFSIHLPFLCQTNRTEAPQTTSPGENGGTGNASVWETLDECKQALADANLTASDVDEIIMVGGSSRIPLIQTMVQDLFSRPLNNSTQTRSSRWAPQSKHPFSAERPRQSPCWM